MTMNITILTHDGLTYETAVEAYDAVQLNDDLNNGEINTVVIGDMIFSRINVKSVVPTAESLQA
jgi:hypothetical protein